MALEDQTFGIANVTFPLVAATTNGLLLDADPSCYYLLDFLASVIGTHLGDRWEAECALAGRTDITSAIASRVPYDPAPYLRGTQYEFPMLAVYRERETYRETDSVFAASETDWAIDYVLPPMSAGDAERLLPMLRAVGAVVNQRLGASQDDAYSTTESLCDRAGFASAVMDRAEYGSWQHGDDLSLPAIRMHVRTVEKEFTPSGAYDSIGAIQDAHVDLATNDGLLGDVAIVRIDTDRGFDGGEGAGFG